MRHRQRSFDGRNTPKRGEAVVFQRLCSKPPNVRRGLLIPRSQVRSCLAHERLREDVAVEAADLLDLRVPDGAVTEDGLRLNVRVAIQYLASWLRGTGAAAIENLMEDAATAEISRSQVWQWIDAGIFTRARVREVEEDELARLRESLGADYDTSRLEEARRLFEEVALGDELVEFLTLPGYERLCALHDER